MYKLSFFEKLRENEKFNSFEKLKIQIEKDIEKAKNYFK